MREYHLNLNEYRLSKWQYLELKAICRQYRTCKKIAHRETWAADRVRLIETAARETVGDRHKPGLWYNSLIRNCCDGLAVDKIEQYMLPTSSRNAYFAARREYLARLWWLLHEGTSAGLAPDHVGEAAAVRPA